MDRTVLRHLSYGMYVVASTQDGRYNGQVANAVFQVCADPVVVAACINRRNLTHEYIEDSRVFTVSILEEETPMTFIGRFGYRSGRDLDKLDGVDHTVGATGAPVVTEHALGYIEAEVTGSMELETHTLYAGRVVDAAMLGDGTPMTYVYYRHVKGGRSPETAPTYLPEE